MEAQYKHLCREAAAQARKIAEAEKLQAIFLVGSDRLTRPMEAEFPKQWRERVVKIKEDFGRLTLPICKRGWRRNRGVGTCKRIGAGEESSCGRAQNGGGHGRDAEPVAEGQNADPRACKHGARRLHECIECGWMDRSADPVCPVCGRERRTVELRDTLPNLARSTNTGIEVVSGLAGEKLSQSGGMGGWLRGRTQAQLR